MAPLAEQVIRYGYPLMMACVVSEQLGLPVPAVPMLLAVGAWSATGAFSIPVALLLAVAPCLFADLVWYSLGRAKGVAILRLICRLSLEPDSCVSGTKRLYSRLGPSALLVSKFIPGLSTAATPLAGMTRMALPRFLLFDAAGSAFWASAYLLLGYLFRSQLEALTLFLFRTGAFAVSVLGSAFVLYLALKYWQRLRFRRQLRIARVSPEEVYEQIQAGEKPFIIDLRHGIEVETEQAVLPGAVRMEVREIEQRHREIPRDQDVIVYCS